MKHIKLFTLYTLGILGLLFFGCDKVEGPYSVKINVESNRKILLEDFTGHLCQACPASHDEAKRLHDIYGKQLIVLSIHAGYFATTNPAFTSGSDTIFRKNDFQSSTGTTIATDFGLIFTFPNTLPFPKGLINRLYKPATSSQYIFDWPDWESTIDSLIRKPADAELNIYNSFNQSDSLITASIDIKLLNNYPNPINLAAYIVEDSIVAPQKKVGTNDLNYIHRHVLRGSFNGAFGSTIINNATQGLQINRTISTKLTPVNANVNQVYIYALLFDSVTKEIIQVEEKKLIE